MNEASEASISATSDIVLIDGFVDEISTDFITGWVRNLGNPRESVAFDVVIALPDSSTIIATAMADQPYPALAGDTVSGPNHGFQIAIPAYLTAHERNHLQIHIPACGTNLKRAPDLQGFIDECSIHHVAGWVRNRFNPTAKISVDVILPHAGTAMPLGVAKANRFYPPLAGHAGTGYYGFSFFFPRPLTTLERDSLIVRPVGSSYHLERSPSLNTDLKIISFIAMDIVNNCNLRCPFCLFDYADVKSTKLMSLQTFDAALQLIPFVDDGNFWLSCLHEPSLHPAFLDFIERIPRQWRHKVMFTTNLAKRQPAAYFEALAASGVHHINISLESLDPKIFERMRKGARFPIFQENWNRLLTAWQAEQAPPDLIYIIMAYQSNLREIPGLVKHLWETCRASKIDIRYTYDMDHIDPAFRAAEYLQTRDWDWLEEQLQGFDPDKICLSRPPRPLTEPLEKIVVFEAAGPAPRHLGQSTANQPANAVTRVERGADFPLNMEVRWDGDIIISGEWDHPSERRAGATGNIADIGDIYPFLVGVPARPKIQGYVDEISAGTIRGWVRNLYDPRARVEVEVVISQSDRHRVIAHGIADQPYPALLDTEFGDANYGFAITLPHDLSETEADHLLIIPAGTAEPLQRAPRYQGFVDELSDRHIAGWARDRFAPSRRIPIDIIANSPRGEEKIGTVLADRFYPLLDQIGLGDGFYGFRWQIPASLPAELRRHIITRPHSGSTDLEISPRLITKYHPIENFTVELASTHPLRPWLRHPAPALNAALSPADFTTALQCLPVIQKAGFRLGHLYEPTANPDFAALLTAIPLAERAKISLHTALSAPLSEACITAIATSGIEQITILIDQPESGLTAAIRSAAAHDIFQDNWRHLLTAIQKSATPPKLCYRLTISAETFRGTPAMVKHLGHAGMANSIIVETPTPSNLRSPVGAMDVSPADLDWLTEQLAGYQSQEVMIQWATRHRDDADDFATFPTLPNLLSAITAHQPGEDNLPLSGRMQQDGRIIFFGPWRGRSRRDPIGEINPSEIPELLKILMA